MSEDAPRRRFRSLSVHCPTSLPAIAAMLVVWLAFLVFGAVRSPVPAVNEPHYLTKALHLVDPSFAPRDFFLNSSNPHLVFYTAMGPIVKATSFPTAAWIGRIIGYGLLAVGWVIFAKRLTGSATGAVLATALLLCISAIGNFSGEWLIGGIESKVFAYAFLFLTLERWTRARYAVGAFALGMATSFHPVVGIWGGVCIAAADAWAWKQDKPNLFARGWQTVAACLLLWLVAALPGLAPAVASLGAGSPADAARANYLQVFVRLKHHLDPSEFPIWVYLFYAVLAAIWAGLWFGGKQILDDEQPGAIDTNTANGWFNRFVIAALAIALLGIAVGLHSGPAWTMPLRNVRGGILKFYPFRLGDLMLPIAVAIGAARLVSASARHAPLQRIITASAAAGLVFAFSLLLPSPDRSPTRYDSVRLRCWIDVCHWMRDHTPSDALAVPVSNTWGFRWYSQRADYVIYKDAPQDAAGLLEWERRFDVLKQWWQSIGNRPVTPRDFARLSRMTDAEWFITDRPARYFTAHAAYDNGWYRVYALR